jgi:hypothetical protein
MKSTIFAVALLMSGAALAQTYPATTPPPEPTMTEPAASPTTPVPTMTTQAPPAVPAMEQTVAPSNAAPEHDARGIAVISDPATAPAGFNQPVGAMTGMGGPLIENPALPTQPADQSYPPCSRTVTDNCVQTYERGRSPQ